MESRKGRLIRSLRFRLCLFLSLIGVLFTAGTCYRFYSSSTDDTMVFIDEELSSIAGVIINYDMLIPKRWEVGPFIDGRPDRRQPPPRRPPLNRMQHDAAKGPVPSLNDLFEKHQDIIIAPLYVKPGEPIYFPADVEDGFYSVLIQDRRVRAFVATNNQGSRFVVARPLSILSDLGNKAMWNAIMEFLILNIIFIPGVVILVNLMFISVNRLASDIYRRRENDLSPLDAKVPSELDPLIGALNRLFLKTGESMQKERRFVANAAHELRTPLTALSLEADALDEAALPESEARKVGNLKKAIRRQRDLTSDLLTLARSQMQSGHEEEPFSLKELFVEIIEEQGAVADSRDIDFGVDGDCDFTLVSDRRLVKTILSNLTSNALKYTPAGGRVDLAASRDAGLTLYVRDSGPGIAPGELDKVFEPFYRVGGDTAKIYGTGLGLAIALSCALELGCSLKLSNRDPHGLEAALTFAPKG